jgi:sugar phosphate isomerase/epimerase
MAKINLAFCYPHWGSEKLPVKQFFQRAIDNGFEGIEINIPQNKTFIEDFSRELEDAKKDIPDFMLIGQQVLDFKKETPEEYLARGLNRLDELVVFQPDFINSHTGKDHYLFDENCRIIEGIENFASKNNVQILHEIHRGRFTFHSATTLKYLEKFPELKLVGDLSHWCLVSESILQDQEEIIEGVIPHIKHLHARIGFEQAPQVNHPFAPEWEKYVEAYLGWWQKIIQTQSESGVGRFSITPEFGPYPYMPQLPFTKQPIANQHQINTGIKSLILNRFGKNAELI